MRRSNRVLVAAAFACSLVGVSASLAADDVGSAAARAAGAAKREASPAPTPAPAAAPAPAASTAPAATIADLEAAEAKVESIKERLPFTQRNVMFVSTKAESFRDAEKRPTNVFAKGEVLRSYAEPLGYALKPAADGGVNLAMTMDFAIKTAGGQVIASQNGFDKVNLTYSNRTKPLFLNLSLNITGIEAGDYVLVYTLHDETSGKVTSFEQPFSIKG